MCSHLELFSKPSDGATRDRWGDYGQSSKTFSLGVLRGRARQETQAGMTLLSPSLLAGELCPHSLCMSRFTPSDGIKKRVNIISVDVALSG